MGEHVHLAGELLEALLVGHAEALLLVHHQQPQVLELHILLEKPVGADQKVDAPLLQAAEGLLHLGGRAEAGDHVDLHRVLGKALLGAQIVLPGQDGGGHQDSGLLPVQDAFHNGPEGHLGLAVAHISAQQPVHGPGLLHVPLDLGDAAELVVGLGVLELLLKLVHPGRVGGKGVARLALALGVELDEALGQVLDRLFRLAFGPLPVPAAQLGELALLLGVLSAADVLVHQVQLGGRHVEDIPSGVGDLQIVLFNAVHRHLDHLQKAAHAVVLMDHQVPGGQVGIGFEFGAVGHRPARLFGGGALPLGEDGKAQGGELQPRREAPHGNDGFPRLGQGVEGEVHGGAHALLPQESLEVLGALLRARQHHRPVALVHIVGEIGGGRLQAGPVGGKLLGQHREQRPRPPGVLGGGKGVQIRRGPVLQPLAELLQGADKAPLRPGQRAVFQQGGHVLPHLPEVVLAPVHDPAALAVENHRVGGKIVGGGGHFRVEEGQIPVHRREGHLGFQPLQVLLQRLYQGGLVPLPAARPGEQVLQRPRQSRRAAGRQLWEDLGGGEDVRLPQVLHPALAVRVEEAHGVDLVAEELEPHRLGVGRGEEVQNSAPQGELAHALHLLAAGVARRSEGGGQLLQRAPVPGAEGPAGFGQERRGNGALEEGLHRRHSEGALSRQEGGEGREPPVLVLPGDHRRVVEGKLPGKQALHPLPGEGGEVPGQAFGLPLVGTQEYHAPSGLLPHSGGHIGPVDGRKAGKNRRTAPCVNGGEELLKFGQVFQCSGQQFHGGPS